MFRKIPAVANGHNYQNPRLRLYLPGTGDVLSAVALMAAGWDGSNGPNPGFHTIKNLN